MEIWEALKKFTSIKLSHGNKNGGKFGADDVTFAYQKDVCVFLFFPPQFSGVVPGVIPRTNSNGILSGWHRKTPLERTYVQYMYPIGSMYIGISTCIYHKNKPNEGKHYTIHGSYGYMYHECINLYIQFIGAMSNNNIPT